MKNVIKAMNKHGKGFEYLRDKFPKLSDAKLKQGIIIGPQIHGIIKLWSICMRVDGNCEICMTNIQSSMSKFPWKCKR
jgi:hypothetical protein